MTQKQKDSVNTIYQSGNDLLGLINGILDLSKVASGKMDVSYESISSVLLANSIRNTFKIFMDDKGLDFTIHIEPDFPENIVSDRTRLEQILRNFISNAFKFTEKGNIVLTFKRPAANTQFSEIKLDRTKAIAFSVQDSGLGISKQNQKLIFEAFKQEDSGISKVQGGTGLGLSVAKGLASLLGGEIQLRSEKGEGSTFTLYLPEKMEITPGKQYDSKQNSVIMPGRFEENKISSDEIFIDKTLLLVDDDMRDIFSLKQALDYVGFKVLVGRNGKEALTQLEKNKEINMILMDILMPDMNGYEAIKRIRTSDDFKEIPIIALTAKAMKGDRAKCLEAGASDYIAKPIDVTQLFSLLRTWLK